MECNPAIVADGMFDQLVLNHIKVEVEMKQEVDVHSSDDSQIYFNSNTIKTEEDLDRGCSSSELVIVQTSPLDESVESLSSIEYNPTVVANDSADPLLLNHIKEEIEMKQEVDVHSSDDSQIYFNSNTIKTEEDLDRGCSSSELVIVQTSPLDESVESVTNIEYAPTIEKDDCVDPLLLNHIKTEVEVKQEVDFHSLDDSQSHYSSNTIKKEDLDRGRSSSELVVVKRTASIDETGESNFETGTRREHLSKTLSTYKDNVDVSRLYINGNLSVGINRSSSLQSNNESINHADINNITQCNVCLETFLNSQDLAIHMKAHKSSKSYECHVCNKSFNHSKNMKAHQRIHFGIKPYKCDVCEKSFTQSCSLTVHERIHTGSKPFQCSVCKKSFSQSGTLKVHERIHTGTKPFQCRFCEKSFSRSGYLRGHERIHMGSKPYKCSYCEKTFSVCRHLRNHEKTHLVIQPHICVSCEKSFSTLHDLKVHERTHSGNKPFICSFCGKACSRSHVLKIHERIHTGYKPYVCTFCEKQFLRSDDLRKHERIHTGSKPYKCSLCDKEFSVSSSYIAHERTHSGIKPYKCSICEKSFSRSGKLKIHEKTHLNIKQ